MMNRSEAFHLFTLLLLLTSCVTTKNNCPDLGHRFEDRKKVERWGMSLRDHQQIKGVTETHASVGEIDQYRTLSTLLRHFQDTTAIKKKQEEESTDDSTNPELQRLINELQQGKKVSNRDLRRAIKNSNSPPNEPNVVVTESDSAVSPENEEIKLILDRIAKGASVSNREIKRAFNTRSLKTNEDIETYRKANTTGKISFISMFGILLLGFAPLLGILLMGVSVLTGIISLFHYRQLTTKDGIFFPICALIIDFGLVLLFLFVLLIFWGF